MYKIFNEQEFKEFTKPLYEMVSKLEEVNLIWKAHENAAINLHHDNRDMNAEHEKEYMDICTSIGNGIVSILQSMDETEIKLTKLMKD